MERIRLQLFSVIGSHHHWSAQRWLFSELMIGKCRELFRSYPFLPYGIFVLLPLPLFLLLLLRLLLVLHHHLLNACTACFCIPALVQNLCKSLRSRRIYIYISSNCASFENMATLFSTRVIVGRGHHTAVT